MNTCPCGSGKDYADCCEPIITGSKPAETAEQLMRARYSAHAKVEVDFLFESTHPSRRDGYDHKGTETWAAESEWHGLEIVDTTKGGPNDKDGEVEFVARFRDKSGLRRHHELAEFTKEDGTWYFKDGNMVKDKPLSVTKVGRNEPCPCGSGQKYKKCCGK